MIKTFIINILLLLPVFSSAQYSIEGYIHNRENNVIPYTAIYDSLNDQGTYSDINGYFKLNVKELPVTLNFSNVGYNTKRRKILDEQKSLKIILEERVTVLNEVVVQVNQPQSKYIGSPKKDKGILYMGVKNPFDQIGLVVNNNDGQLYSDPIWLAFSVKISSWTTLGIVTGVKPTGERQARLRFYELSDTYVAGNELVNKNIFLSPSRKGWYTIDTKDLNLKLPKKGFVVALEWLDNQPRYIWDSKKYYSEEYGFSIDAHLASSNEKEFYSVARLISFTDWIVPKINVERDYIPCYRLKFVELDKDTR